LIGPNRKSVLGIIKGIATHFRMVARAAARRDPACFYEPLDSVSNVDDEVGYESPSSFIAAFEDSFGTTPTSYFENMHNRRVSKE
jgi:AraC-like DNA-binding protein